MPTGYTEKLMDKGQSFPEFAMDCARAFGACITLRDEGFDKPIPEVFEPSQWNAKELAKAKAKLENLEAMSGDQRGVFCRAQKQKAIKDARRRLQESRAENTRLDAMLVAVKAWTPPTGKHTELKNFMLEQLGISRDSTDYPEQDLAEAEAKSTEQYYADAVAGARRGIEYYKREQTKENERASDRSEWVRQLRESLACPA